LVTTTLLLPRARSLSGVRAGAPALGVDAVRADLVVAGNDVAPGPVFNVTGGADVSAEETLSVFSSLAGHTLEVDCTDRIAGDVFRTGDATDEIREAVGWSGPVGIDECLARPLAWSDQTLGWGQ
jgi:UDP-glucose 4-epimerase